MDLEKVKVLIQPVVEDLGLEILEVVYIPRGRNSVLRVTIDRESALVNLDDCTEASRHIARLLDVEDPIPGSFRLEVTSPGFKRLIRIPKDLPRFIDCPVKIKTTEKLEGRTVWKGILKSARDPLILENQEIGELSIPLKLISKANLNE